MHMGNHGCDPNCEAVPYVPEGWNNDLVLLMLVSGKPRGRYARVAFELVLRNLGLITSCTGGRLRARTTSPQFLVCPMDSEYPIRAAHRLHRLGAQPRRP